MVCDCTFMCPRRLFSSPIGSRLWCTQRQEAATVSLFQLQWVYKQANSGQIISLTTAAASTTPLQDLPSPLHLLLFLDFSCPDLKNMLANAPLTFTCKSPHCWLHPIREGSPMWQGTLFVAQSSCSCELDTAGATHPTRQDAHCGLGFAFFMAQYLLRYCLEVTYVLLDRMP